MASLLANGDAVTVPLFVSAGSHYAWMHVGSPPQRVAMTLDTRSSLLTLPCSGCADCSSSSSTRVQAFEAAQSSTWTQVGCSDASSYFRCEHCDNASAACDVTQTRTSGSTFAARIAEDVLYLEGSNSGETSAGSRSEATIQTKFATTFKFGCRYRETGAFASQSISGLLGLANSDNTLVATLFREKKIPTKLLSLCLTPDGGSMRLGTVDTSRHTQALAYARLAPDPLNSNLFSVELKDVQIGDKSLSVAALLLSSPLRHLVVDTGAATTRLPVAMRAAFLAAFKHATGLDYASSVAQCSGYSREQVAHFPDIHLALEGASGSDLVLTLTPGHYLLAASSDRFCGAIMFTDSQGGSIGATAMLHRDVVIDAKSDRIGFTAANCTFEPSQALLSAADATSASSSLAAMTSGSSDVSASLKLDNSTGDASSSRASAQLSSSSESDSSSYLRAFLIGGAVCVVVIVVALVLVLRRAKRRRGFGNGDGVLRLSDFEDDDGDGSSGEALRYEPQESFVTPHFLIHSPALLVARSPRTPPTEAQRLEFEQSAVRQSRRCSGAPQRVEL